MVDYIRGPTPHDNFCGGSDTWVVWANVWLVTSLSFFLFLCFFLSFFCFLQRVPRSHFLTDQDDIYAKMCFRPRMCLLRVTTISDYILGSNRKKTSPKWAGIDSSQPNRCNSKIAIYWSPMKIFGSNLTDRLTTGSIIEKMQNYVKLGREGVTWPTFWILGPPLANLQYSRKWALNLINNTKINRHLAALTTLCHIISLELNKIVMLQIVCLSS